MLDDLHTTPLSRRRFLARSAVAAGAAAGAGSLLGVAGVDRAEASRARDTKTLTVMYYGNTENTNELTKHAIKQFEQANPGVTIRFINYDPIRLSASLASGQPPDFIRTIGASEMPNLIARGLALNLDPYFNASAKLKPTNLMPVTNVYRWDGHVQGQGSRYGMVKDWSQDNMFWYDKSLFRRAGVPFPSATEPLTFDELLAIGKKLTVRKNGKIQVYGLNAEFGTFTQGRLIQMVGQQGKAIYNSDFTQIDLTTPEARRALKWFVDVAQAHISPSPLDPDANWDGVLFPANRVAISLFGYWFGYICNVPGPNHQPVTDCGIAPAPQMGPKRINACMTGTGAWIPQASQNKDLAWRFMEFFMAGPPAVERARQGSGMPALRSLLPDLPHSTPYQKAAYEVQLSQLKYLSILHFSPYISNDAFEAAFTKYMVPVMKGQVSLDTGAKQLTDAINQLLRQGKAQVG